MDARQVVAVSSVDITGVTAAARADAVTYRETDPAYAELMATYAALGDLLDTDPDPAECAALLAHATAVAVTVDYHAGQRRARWLVHNTTFEGGA
ncbi:hypothetical protein ACIBCH_41835 [Amycolatopsis thailandensis]|uniref:hypothetical protein n=1 Tax=Amycolatopsis thailandensis TaxID=589330 RepID=UPI0037AD3C33